MMEQAWSSGFGWFPASTQYTGRAAKGLWTPGGASFLLPRRRSCALTLFPSGVERLLPPFYSLQKESRDLEAG